MKKQLRYSIKGNHDGTGLRKMRQDADKSVNHVKSRMAGLGASLRGGLAGGIAGGLAANLGNPFREAAEAIEHLDKIAKTARTAGISSKFYQTLVSAANDASIAQATLDSSLVSFVKRMGELQAGAGPLATTLSKVDGELVNMLLNARSQEEAFRIAADRIATYKDATKESAVNAVLFNKSGVVMNRVLNQGSAGLDAAAERAKKLGLVIKDDLLTQAEQLQTDYGAAMNVVDTQSKAAFVAAAPILKDMAELAAQVAMEVRGITEAWKEMASADNSRTKTANDFTKQFGPFGRSDGGIAGRLGTKTNNFLFGTGQFQLPQTSNTDGKSDLGSIRSPALGSAGGSGAGSVGGLANPPTGLVDKSEIGGLASEIKGLNSVFDTTIEKTATWQDTLRSGLDGFGSSLLGVARGTETLNSLLDRTLSRFADMLANQAFNGLLGAAFGSAFGGGGFGQQTGGFIGGGPINAVPPGFSGLFARGGTLGAGQYGIGGEAGPEIVSGPAKITPVAGMGGGGRPSVVINNYSSAKVEDAGTGTDAQGNPFQRLVVRDAVQSEMPGGLKKFGGGFGLKPALARR